MSTQVQVMEDGALDLQKYDVSLETGFLLQDPLEDLPTYFDPWKKLASNLSNLLEEKKFREEVHKLDQLDASVLDGHRELRLAHLQLSLIASGYVWQDGDKGVATVLPRCVAVPYCVVSDRLSIPPVLNHASLVLANWARVDRNGSYDPENLKCLYGLPGEKGAEWFVTVTVFVERNFVQCLKPILRILEEMKCAGVKEVQGLSSVALDSQAKQNIAYQLDKIRDGIKAMHNALSRMHDRLTARTFFNVLRPLLGGWGGEGNSLPDGLIYEGISDTPRKLTGGSAAQSSTMQVLDALFGVKHTQEKRRFLVHMRDFMPVKHRRLIEDLERWPCKLRELVLTCESHQLKTSFNTCISALVDLRTYHIQIVTKYIVVASREINEGNYESLDNKGTGGTSLIPFLKVIRSDTEDQLVCDNKNKLPKSSTADQETQSEVGISVPTHPPGLLLLIAVASTLAVGILVRSMQN